MSKHILLAVLCLAMAQAVSANAEEPAQVVLVNGIKNPEMRSYRSVSAGLDMFDEHRELAPKVSQLRFRMRPMARDEDPDSEPLALRIVGSGDSIPVAIGADGVFTIPRSEQAYDDDADLILNRKRGQFRAVPEIRTPDLPPNVRRLGDLRLECRVSLAIIKPKFPFMARVAITTLLMTTDWCGKLTTDFTAPRKLSGATLQHGERKQALPVKEWDYSVPLGGDSWPDDALIEFSFADS